MLFLISITEIVYGFSSIKIIKFKSFSIRKLCYRQYANNDHFPCFLPNPMLQNRTVQLWCLENFFFIFFKTKMIQHIEHHIRNWFVWLDISIKLVSTLYAQRINREIVKWILLFTIHAYRSPIKHNQFSAFVTIIGFQNVCLGRFYHHRTIEMFQ